MSSCFFNEKLEANCAIKRSKHSNPQAIISSHIQSVRVIWFLREFYMTIYEHFLRCIQNEVMTPSMIQFEVCTSRLFDSVSTLVDRPSHWAQKKTAKQVFFDKKSKNHKFQDNYTCAPGQKVICLVYLFQGFGMAMCFPHWKLRKLRPS